MKARNFLGELKRRNVYKVGVAYLVGGWALSQGVAQLLPVFDVPTWVIRLLLLAIILGLPVALVIAWMFEITPDGLKRVEDMDPAASKPSPGRAWIFVVFIGAAFSLGLFFVGRYTAQNRAFSSQLPSRSIAVLPFENLSRDPDNAYFAVGIQDEILTRLSRIADLKVISRTSTRHYQSAPKNLSEIARQLGVAHILEGSVQRSGDTVRVIVQLIRANDDSHLWADTFDRKLNDLFAVESEVAKAIADQLQAKLTGREAQIIAEKPTENPLAYDAFLRGIAYVGKTEFASENVVSARKYFQEAVRLDPKFALAWAALSQTASEGYAFGALPKTEEIREEARQAAETALKLQPNLGEALMVTALYHTNCLNDYETAERYLERARRVLPSDSRIPRLLAPIARQRGEWEQSEAYLKEAERLDPRNPKLLFAHASSLAFQRRFDEALRKYEEVLSIIPDDTITLVQQAGVAQAQGDLPRAAALLKPLPMTNKHVLFLACYQSLLERNPARIITWINGNSETVNSMAPDDRATLRLYLGWAHEIMGDHEAALENWRQSRTTLEPNLKVEPEAHFLIADLAFLNAALGDKAAAFTLAERGTSIVPVKKNALFGPMMIEVLARVAAVTGERDRAIVSLQAVLRTPYAGPMPANLPLTPARLRLDPMFDPLRNDQRFQKLCQENQD